ncbi:MAG: glycosyltransferase family 2 protein, partial [Sulfitobacter sp.]|nr:glycosyltransferase family 2 protein [Sulfitobacter sp.]
ISPWALLGLLLYPLQIVRLARRGGLAWASLTTLGKFAEAQGALRYYLRRRPSEIIEYK